MKKHPFSVNLSILKMSADEYCKIFGEPEEG
jgi:hypothetical protein